jgi:hypothetical protein
VHRRQFENVVEKPPLTHYLQEENARADQSKPGRGEGDPEAAFVVQRIDHERRQGKQRRLLREEGEHEDDAGEDTHPNAAAEPDDRDDGECNEQVEHVHPCEVEPRAGGGVQRGEQADGGECRQ